MNHKLLRLLFLIIAPACIALRVYLKIAGIDPSTGFYDANNIIVTLFSVLIYAGSAGLFLLGLLFSRKRQPGSLSYTPALRFLAIIAGISALAYAGGGFFMLMGRILDYGMGGMGIYLPVSILSVLSAFLFLMIGRRGAGESHSVRLNPFFLLCPLLWQAAVLLASFMSYTAIRNVSDQKLTIVMLILLLPFLLAYARVLGGVDPAKGFRQIVCFGYPFALVSLTLSAGLIAAAVTGRHLEIAMPVTASVFYLCMGLYAARLTLSVKLK